MKKIETIFNKYKHGIPMLMYMLIYMVWFKWLEENNSSHYQLIHMNLDDYIPFCEVFIVPYLCWFGYVAITVLFFFFKDKDDYYKLTAFLVAGMTIFLIISTFFPNGHKLRPIVMPRQNIFTAMVAHLYKMDTPTNLWPSIHVFNSLGCFFAVIRSNLFKKKIWIKLATLILTASIVLSTMFLKQHSVFDVITAFALAAILYTFIYRKDLLLTIRTNSQKNKQSGQMG